MKWVDIVSLGNSSRSTTSTRRPWRASSWATLAPAERKRKIHTYLAGRGFDYSTIEEVMRASVAEDED